MSATPTYDNVVEELRIDPVQIAARPAWSVQAAERRSRHEDEVLSPTAGDLSAQQPHARQTLSGQVLSTPTAAAT